MLFSILVQLAICKRDKSFLEDLVLVKKKATYEVARKLCNQEGGYLAEFDIKDSSKWTELLKETAGDDVWIYKSQDEIFSDSGMDAEDSANAISMDEGSIDVLRVRKTEEMYFVCKKNRAICEDNTKEGTIVDTEIKTVTVCDSKTIQDTEKDCCNITTERTIVENGTTTIISCHKSISTDTTDYTDENTLPIMPEKTTNTENISTTTTTKDISTATVTEEISTESVDSTSEDITEVPINTTTFTGNLTTIEPTSSITTEVETSTDITTEELTTIEPTSSITTEVETSTDITTEELTTIEPTSSITTEVEESTSIEEETTPSCPDTTIEETTTENTISSTDSELSKTEEEIETETTIDTEKPTTIPVTFTSIGCGTSFTTAGETIIGGLTLTTTDETILGGSKSTTTYIQITGGITQTSTRIVENGEIPMKMMDVTVLGGTTVTSGPSEETERTTVIGGVTRTITEEFIVGRSTVITIGETIVEGMTITSTWETYTCSTVILTTNTAVLPETETTVVKPWESLTSGIKNTDDTTIDIKTNTTRPIPDSSTDDTTIDTKTTSDSSQEETIPCIPINNIDNLLYAPTVTNIVTATVTAVYEITKHIPANATARVPDRLQDLYEYKEKKIYEGKCISNSGWFIKIDSIDKDKSASKSDTLNSLLKGSSQNSNSCKEKSVQKSNSCKEKSDQMPKSCKEKSSAKCSINRPELITEPTRLSPEELMLLTGKFKPMKESGSTFFQREKLKEEGSESLVSLEGENLFLVTEDIPINKGEEVCNLYGGTLAAITPNNKKMIARAVRDNTEKKYAQVGGWRTKEKPQTYFLLNGVTSSGSVHTIPDDMCAMPVICQYV
eukprot:GHVP01021417.1.p1 GENE.GHVP01021417.1~~GHVP01021417.1.p1  ORF type:complete len:849 (+),score=166.06 GHVP01021417.1:163-2709(+)